MTPILTNKQDLHQLELATRHDVEQLRQEMNARLQWEREQNMWLRNFDQRCDLLEKNLEFRIVMKLGTLAVTLFLLTIAAMIN